MKNFTVYTTVALLFTGLTFFALGFFFGYKTKIESPTPETVVTNYQAINSSSSSVVTSTAVVTNTNTAAVTDVFWIRVGTNPVCPDTHPIKGKFYTSTAKFYYTSENRSYDRVRPDICFTTEEFARETAGFVKKF